jgi:hypothetical protein
VETDDPGVSVILLDRWELMDRRLNGRYQHVGEPEYDAYLSRELDLAISIVAARNAHVVLLTAPYTRRTERPDGGLWPEDRPARVDAWNDLLHAAAGRDRARPQPPGLPRGEVHLANRRDPGTQRRAAFHAGGRTAIHRAVAAAATGPAGGEWPGGLNP